ncbi:MAG: hypothetical protein GXY32_01505 [Ruminococcaceae bacterium]|nr:hypothetical protein [Oscillospiraceae bacterium]
MAGCSAQPQAVSSSVPPADSSVTASFSVPPAAPLPEKEDWRVLCLLGGLDDERNVELARGVQDGFTRLGIAVVMDDSYAPRLAEGEPMLEDGQPLPASLLDGYDAVLSFQLLPYRDALEQQLAERDMVAVSAGWAVDGALLYGLAYENEYAVALGQAAGQWMNAHDRAAGRVVLLQRQGGGYPSRLHYINQGLMQALPGLANDAAEWLDLGENLDAAELVEMIMADGNVAAVLASEDAPALALATALEAAGYDKAIYIGSVSGSAEAQEAVAAEGLFTATLNPRWYEAGQALADAVAAGLQGEAMPAEVPGPLLVERAG